MPLEPIFEICLVTCKLEQYFCSHKSVRMKGSTSTAETALEILFNPNDTYFDEEAEAKDSSMGLTPFITEARITKGW